VAPCYCVPGTEGGRWSPGKEGKGDDSREMPHATKIKDRGKSFKSRETTGESTLTEKQITCRGDL